MATRAKVGLVGCLAVGALLLPVAVTARSETIGKPLHITGRLLQANELPAFVPAERAGVVTNVTAWNKVAPSGGVDVTNRLRKAGFVAAVREDLRWTKGTDRGALSAVVRLGSARAAQAEIAQELRDFAHEPGSRGVLTYTRFRVSTIPGAHGFSKTATDGAGHNIVFADGPFTYHVGVGWGPQVKDPPTRVQLIAAATSLYLRVHGRPAPR